MMGINRRKNSDLGELLEEEKKKLFEEWENDRKILEHEIEKERAKKGLMLDIDDKVLYPIMNHHFKDKQLNIVCYAEIAREANEKMEECFIGVRYGVKLLDGEKEFFNITTLLDGDGMFVSEIASRRRTTNFLFAQNLAEYIKSRLVNEFNRREPVREIQILIEKNVGNNFFSWELGIE